MAETVSGAVDINPFFLPSPRGPLFCLSLAPANQPARGGILYLHPFAEEMHKSRRMAALQARAFAGAGYAVLQPDLTGCGDSAGDFGDADWESWKDDARLAHAWLNQQGVASITLWGLRTGASLAAELARELTGIDRLVLCQPVVNGDAFLNQFLRIKLAGEMLSTGQAQSGTKRLRAQLEAGDSVEVGGYRLSPALARALAGWKPADHVPPCPTHWFEIGAGEALSPASQRVADAWLAAGTALTTRPVVGEPFWGTQEITECPALLAATLKECAA
ncbi:hydrolase 2, exosortase A system-associated [Methylomagnum sp.]